MARKTNKTDVVKVAFARLWLVSPFLLASLLVLAIIWVILGQGNGWFFAIAGVLVSAVWFAAPLDPTWMKDNSRSARSIKAMEAWGMSLVDSLPYPCIIVDRRLALRVTNTHAQGVFSRLVVDSPLSFSLRVPEVLSSVRRVLISGKSETVFFIERLPVTREYRVTISPMKAPEPFSSKRPVFAILTFHDMTESRKLNEMRADFVANASHELRTPLAAMMGFVETLQGPAAKDEAARARFLPIILAQAQRMARLVDDLLSLSRIELKSHVQPDDEVDVGLLLASTCEMLNPLARAANVTLQPLKALPSPLTVRGDSDELMQVLQNLIENAIKYNNPQGQVQMSLTDNEDHIDIAVTDTGPGIAEEHLPRLTERFYRVDANSSREKGGTGLGLAIVKHIINRHRGSLNVRSELNKGTTFIVSLPKFKKDV
jgi:two-component system phosphate regulon sensor histidine kinase PhoR